MIENIRIVLVNTSHPGNIGAAARAMKTMGLSRLYLVEPRDYPSEEAVTRASGADDILANAVVCRSLDEALENCALVMGTTARERSISAEPVSPRQAAEQALRMAEEAEIALVFGRERSGLTNEELDRCQTLIHIDANPDYSSLNLGSAVQVLSYEVRMAWLAVRDQSQNQSQDQEKKDVAWQHHLDRRANFQEMESFYGHLQTVLTELDFLKQSNPTLIMRRLRCLYDRAAPTVRELNILRGALSASQSGIQSRGPGADDEYGDSE